MILIQRLFKERKKLCSFLFSISPGFPDLDWAYTCACAQPTVPVVASTSRPPYRSRCSYAPSRGLLGLNSCLVLIIRIDKLPFFHFFPSRNKRLRCGGQGRDFPLRNSEVLAWSKMFEVCHIKLPFLFPNKLHMSVKMEVEHCEN